MSHAIIPVFVPHLGCPNACVFCNQHRITGALPARAKDVEAAMQSETKGAELAFYGGSFTAIPANQQEELLGAARPYLDRLEGIRVSTRPDCIDEEVLERLRRFGVKTIELGAQSMDEEVLKKANRGHSAQQVRESARLVKKAGFSLVLQMMTGLPGDTPSKSVKTAKEFVKLAPDAVRIYPTVIIKDTELYEMYLRGEYKEHTVEDAVELCAEIVPIFEKAEIPIIRLGLNPTQELSEGNAVAGAYHPALGELVYSRIYLKRARALLKETSLGNTVKLAVSPNKISIMTGQHRCNIETLKKEFGLKSLKIVPMDGLSDEILVLP